MLSSDLAKISKDYFIKSSLGVAEAALFSAFPYLNVPPFNFLIIKGLTWLIQKIADGLELLAFFTFVDLRTSEEGNAYVKAAHAANTLQTEESRRLADEAFKRLVSFTS